MSDKKGIALIIVIIIIVIAAVIVMGITSFISSGMSLNIARASMEGAVCAAQAGLYAGIYDYIQNPGQLYWGKSRNINMVENRFYSAGIDANFLLIDASSPRAVGQRIERIPLTNINETDAITANEVSVEWYNFAGASLVSVRLGGISRWSGLAASGERLALTPAFRINPKQSLSADSDNIWQFSANIPSDGTVIATFFFSDGSSRKAYLFNSGKGGNKEFSITATGETRGTTNWKRTIEATYDIGTNNVTSWQEVDDHI